MVVASIVGTLTRVLVSMLTHALVFHSLSPLSYRWYMNFTGDQGTFWVHFSAFGTVALSLGLVIVINCGDKDNKIVIYFGRYGYLLSFCFLSSILGFTSVPAYNNTVHLGCNLVPTLPDETFPYSGVNIQGWKVEGWLGAVYQLRQVSTGCSSTMASLSSPNSWHHPAGSPIARWDLG